MRLFSEAMETILTRGDLVLVYPEQAMWWNYRKPRPFREGAFFYAAKHNVPIVPIFVTMQDQDTLDGDGFPKQAYTIHVMPPIYPDPAKTLRQNEREMLEKNQTLCYDKYKEVYGIEVKYGK
ncbi:MAG: 1-acyl-sn-glycerol-3-phosphate acyltransferase, partial [Clostridia bacterium]|nr:1-acyl-sn-glycerol-3-phosphate acyltransferase [Clostridia bacterium]